MARGYAVTGVDGSIRMLEIARRNLPVARLIHARIEEVEFPHSLGLLYSTLTSYLGFAVNSDEFPPSLSCSKSQISARCCSNSRWASLCSWCSRCRSA